MMKIRLGIDAIRAIILANIAGPNCICFPEKLNPLYNSKREVLTLKEVAFFFDSHFGPISSVVNFATLKYLKDKKNDIELLLDKKDIVGIYSIGHKNIVRVAGFKFDCRDKQYFKELKDTGFSMEKKGDLMKFLFSCIGKVGIVEKIERDSYIVGVWVKGRKIRLHDIFSPISLKKGNKVALHYATIFAKIEDDFYDEILVFQEKDSFWDQFQKIKRIHYRKWLKSDLFSFSQDQYKRLLT